MSPQRKVLETFGRKRGRDYVRVVREQKAGMPAPKIRVLWKENGKERTEGFDDTRKGLTEAKAFASGVHERLKAPAAIQFPPITVRELWERYVNAKVDSWRPATLTNKRTRWNKFELFVGRTTFAHLVTRETFDDFKRQLVKNRHAPNQVKLHIEATRAVFRWGIDRDLVAPSKLTTYVVELSRDQRNAATKMAEFRAEERAKILAALDPRSRTRWRTWALTVLFAYCGPRRRAAFALEWGDVDFVHATIKWRGETDKMGNDRLQPLPAPVLEALWVAYGWRTFEEYTGRFVFFGVQRRTRAHALRRDKHRERAKESIDGVAAVEKPYTYSAYIGQLQTAIAAASVSKIKYRGAHAFRRGIAGDVRKLTGSDKAAADWIGDKSLKVVQNHYLLERADEQREIAAKIGEGDA